MIMSKKRKLGLVEDLNKAVQPAVSTIQWDICVICQKLSGEALINPTEGGIVSLFENLRIFATYNSTPKHLRLQTKEDSDALLQSMLNNNAKYHKVCRTRFNKQKMDRLTKPSNQESTERVAGPSNIIFTRASSSRLYSKDLCIFCDGCDKVGQLVCAATLGIGPNIHAKALALEDKTLLAKLTCTDMVAIEAKYHKDCYTQFLNRFRAIERAKSDRTCYDQTKMVYGSVVSELVEYMQEMYFNGSVSPVFKLSYLTELVVQRMQDLGVRTDWHVNRTRLKQQLISSIPGLCAAKSGREVLLTFEINIGDAIRDACTSNDVSDGMCLARAGKILRRDMFEEYPTFKGSFKEPFIATDTIPAAALSFMKMVLEGPSIGNSKSSAAGDVIAQSLTQLIRFNCVKTKRKGGNERVLHNVQQETPLPLYIGLMIHAQTRSRKLIDKMCKLGLSVSYNRVQEVSATVTNTLCKCYNADGGVVCPPSLHKNIFMTAAIDNIDYNPSSSTAGEAFHGSSITVIQHPDEACNFVTELDMTTTSKTVCADLPEAYTSLPPTGRIKAEKPASTITYDIERRTKNVGEDMSQWLTAVQETIPVTDSEGDTRRVSWAAFHSTQPTCSTKPPCHAVLLPLLPDDINAPATVRHTFDIITAVTRKCNPNQIPVITADQPVYAIAKQLQWKYPETYGEDKMVLLMGGLHIEMAVLSMLGTWLTGSGWTDVLVSAEVASRGRADSFLKASHVKRTRYAHQVTIAALHILREDTFQDYVNSTDIVPTEDFQIWITRRKEESPMFAFWSITIELEKLLLEFVRSIREANFDMYVMKIMEICPWMFALDHVHYARWLSVFVHTLKELPHKHADVMVAFLKGHFTSNKTTRPFSNISDDHLHEQNNKIVKTDGGAVGLFDNKSALLKWMVAGPDMIRIVQEYEHITGITNHNSIDCCFHHEDTCSFEARFVMDVRAVINILRESGNPFQGDILQTVCSSKLIMPKESICSVMSACSLGDTQYKTFVCERLVECRSSVHDVIKRNNLPLFSAPSPKCVSKDKMRLKSLQIDANIFCKMYVACQAREGNIQEFFSHENQQYPPSISEFGRLRKPSNKADIITCIETLAGSLDTDITIPQISASVIDGAALVHMISPGMSKHFDDYIKKQVLPIVAHKLDCQMRVDVVFDRYNPMSLKSDTRLARGTGQRIDVMPKTMIPMPFAKFLSVDDNKDELFKLLAESIVQTPITGKTIICTYEKGVRGSPVAIEHEDMISPCLHEEADSRLLLHVRHAVACGHTHVMIQTVDSDVVIIALFAFRRIPNLQELWIDYGTGKHKRFIPIHCICQQVEESILDRLPFFHAFTGCDTVSAFAGIGKRTAWNVWMKFRDVDEAFSKISSMDYPWGEDIFLLLQRFVSLLYDRSSTAMDVNECRRILFTKRNRVIHNIPPTADALCVHAKRAALQAYTWTQCLVAAPQPMSPCDWGWKQMDPPALGYQPTWTTLPDVSSHCKELISCTCKQRCTRCKCVINHLPCTLLCGCDGHCSRQDL